MSHSPPSPHLSPLAVTNPLSGSVVSRPSYGTFGVGVSHSAQCPRSPPSLVRVPTACSFFLPSGAVSQGQMSHGPSHRSLTKGTWVSSMSSGWPSEPKRAPLRTCWPAPEDQSDPAGPAPHFIDGPTKWDPLEDLGGPVSPCTPCFHRALWMKDVWVTCDCVNQQRGATSTRRHLSLSAFPVEMTQSKGRGMGQRSSYIDHTGHRRVSKGSHILGCGG